MKSTRVAIWLALSVSLNGCFLARGQRFHHFTTPLPLEEKSVLILGFMGGREPWDNDKRGVRRLALKLRSLKLPGVFVETVENKKRALALRLIQEAFDRNRDGKLEGPEKEQVRLILYGQSFGGAAVVKLARRLHRLDIPVELTVQVDSVGRNDRWIPPNVRRAANLYQRDGLFIKGEPRIQAEDPAQTAILGNFRFSYAGKKIDLSSVSWFKKLFRTAHTKMDHDPEVWRKVEDLILDTLGQIQRVTLGPRERHP